MPPELHSYTQLLEDEFEHVTTTERSRAVVLSESEVRKIEEVGLGLMRLGVTDSTAQLLAGLYARWVVSPEVTT